MLEYFGLYLFEAKFKKIINSIKIIVSFLTKTSISARGYSKNIGVYKANLDKKLIFKFLMKLKVKTIKIR
jgi:hypothetical protein